MAKLSIWQDAMIWLQKLEPYLAVDLPPGLPSPEKENFWQEVERLEMATRGAVSVRLEELIEGKFSPVADAATCFFIRRRLEWAARAAVKGFHQNPQPTMSLKQALRWLLVDSWNSDGCVSFWYFAMESDLGDADEPPEIFERVGPVLHS